MTDRLAPMWKLLHEDAPESEFQRIGNDILKELERQSQDIDRQTRLLKELLAWKVPVVKAWNELSAAPTNGQPNEAVRAIVKELQGQGIRKLNTQQVFELMTQRAIKHNWKKPRTAIGNIIIQMHGWRRVAKGVYEFGERGEVK